MKDGQFEKVGQSTEAALKVLVEKLLLPSSKDNAEISSFIHFIVFFVAIVYLLTYLQILIFLFVCVHLFRKCQSLSESYGVQQMVGEKKREVGFL